MISISKLVSVAVMVLPLPWVTIVLEKSRYFKGQQKSLECSTDIEKYTGGHNVVQGL